MQQPSINQPELPSFLEWVTNTASDYPDVWTEPLGDVVRQYHEETARELGMAGEDPVPGVPDEMAEKMATLDAHAKDITTPGADFSEMQVSRATAMMEIPPGGKFLLTDETGTPEPVATCGQCGHWRAAPGMGDVGHCFNPDARAFRAITAPLARACDWFE